MPSWNHLPVEIKQHVVKKLDFMSRHSLKSTSHRDRQIVNSTNFQIPRVRFGYKESKCLIIIYTGIEKFLRLELSKCKLGVMIHRFENSYDPKDISTKILPTTDTLKLGVSILKSLLAHKSIIIKAMEWELPKLHNEYDDEKQRERFLKYFGGAKFRVKEMVYVLLSNMHAMEDLCYMNELEFIRTIGIIVSSENLVPVAAYDIQTAEEFEGIPQCITKLSLSHSEENLAFHTEVVGSRMLSYDRPTVVSSRAFGERENGGTESKVIEENGIKSFFHMTKCGSWMHQMRTEYVDQLREQFDFESNNCGLGLLCKRCSHDPFDYWYQQNLPRRLLHEPFWDGLISPFEMYIDIERETELLKKKLAIDEKEKERIQKGKKNQKTSASWGFRKAPIEDIVFDNKKNQGKKNKKKMKKMIKKGVILKDSDEVKNIDSPEVDDVKNPEYFEEKKDNLCLEDVVLKDSPDQSPEVNTVIVKNESDDNSDNLDTSEHDEYMTASENEEEVKEDVKVMDSPNSTKSYQFLKLFISIIFGPIFLSIIYYSIISYFID